MCRDVSCFLSFTPFFSYFHFGALGGEHYAVEDGKGIVFP